MLELTINNQVYSFRFGLGFVRDVNKTMKKKIDGLDASQDIGLQFAIASLLDEDPVALVEILDVANKTEKPRVTKALLDSYIESEDTDLDELFKDVMDFLSKANATKKMVARVLETVEAERNKMTN